jgi:hypothetical protein
VTAALYLTLASESDFWATAVQSVAVTIHTIMAVRNVRNDTAREVPTIVWPMLMVSW